MAGGVQKKVMTAEDWAKKAKDCFYDAPVWIDSERLVSLFREAIEAEREACAQEAADYAAMCHRNMLELHGNLGMESIQWGSAAGHVLLVRDRIRWREWDEEEAAEL